MRTVNLWWYNLMEHDVEILPPHKGKACYQLQKMGHIIQWL